MLFFYLKMTCFKRKLFKEDGNWIKKLKRSHSILLDPKLYSKV